MTRDTFDMFGEPDRGRFGDNDSAPARGRVTNSSDLVDLTLAKHHQTDRAILVSSNGDENRAVWIPLSRCEVEAKTSYLNGTRKNGSPVNLQMVIVTLPEPVAKEKGLI